MAPSAVAPVDTAATLTAAGIKHTQQDGASSTPAPLSAALLTTTPTSTPRAVPSPTGPEVRSMNICTDHMIICKWQLGRGWAAPTLQAYGPLSLMPTASCLHYATECFEGLKLYRGFDGRLRLFRVSRNCERMRRSALRIALPDFEPRELQKLIVALCKRDGPKWLPRGERNGGFLYIRPSMIGSNAALGVQRPTEAMLFVILTCFPDMTKSLLPTPAPPALSGAAPASGSPAPRAGLKLIASSEDTIRAWPGGFGYAKLGANYGPTLVAQGEARAQGFDQVLWLFGPESYVTEAGASNFFVVWHTPEGKLQLVTAPLEEGIILEGVTRASILDLARQRLTAGTSQANALASLEVVERRFTMDEVLQAQQQGRLVEAFAAGTAYFVAPIGLVHYRGVDLPFPLAADEGKSGAYASLIKSWLVDIMYGREQHEWGVVVEEDSE